MPSRRTFSWQDHKVLHYLETKAFLEAAKVEVAKELGAIPLGVLIEEPPRLMWEHQGECPCGKKSYLFGQCPKCLQEEQLEKTPEEQEKAHDPTPAPAEPSSQVEIEIPAGPLKLPDVLQTPVVRTGGHTQDVEFICPRCSVPHVFRSRDHRRRDSAAAMRGHEV